MKPTPKKPAAKAANAEAAPKPASSQPAKGNTKTTKTVPKGSTAPQKTAFNKSSSKPSAVNSAKTGSKSNPAAKATPKAAVKPAASTSKAAPKATKATASSKGTPSKASQIKPAAPTASGKPTKSATQPASKKAPTAAQPAPKSATKATKPPAKPAPISKSTNPKPVSPKPASGPRPAPAGKTSPPGKPVANTKEPAGKGSSPSKSPKPAKAKGPVSPPPKPTNPTVVKKIRELQASREQRKDLSQDIVVRTATTHGASDINHDPERDRMVLVVRDSFWLHASWEVTRRSVDRAKAAMAEHWHTVRPILRVVKIDNSGTTNNSETIHRDIEIHGGVRNWYIDVSDPPATFRVLLGYVSGGERFHELIRSNIVTTPIPGSDESVSTHWADIAKDAERIFALSGGYSDDRETKDLQEMFEEHLKRPMGAPPLAQFGSGAESGVRRHRNFHFELDAEMIVFGSTHPDAYVTLGGEPVKVQTDGTFSVRVPLPDRRQVLPACACTRDGVDEQTIVIAVERNTKVMEPLSKENEESSQ